MLAADWKTKYRLVFTNDDTMEQRFVIRQITIKKVAVVAIIAAFLLIALTAVLIAFTPLRFYVPGYTTKKEYRLYQSMAAKLDSLETQIVRNQQYIDNFSTMLNGRAPGSGEVDKSGGDVAKVEYVVRDKENMQASENLMEESEMILSRPARGATGEKPTIEEAKITKLTLYPPALGAITRRFDPAGKHFGIDINNSRNSIVGCTADGVVIYSGFTSKDGNMIMVQHPGNVISVYKHNESLLKGIGARVTAGMPIATMGSSGLSENNSPHLHFELWYNGLPLNPLDYLAIE